MFKFNERENSDSESYYFPEGTTLNEVELEPEELIYGYFKAGNSTYYFTSTSLIINAKEQERIRISEVQKTNGSFRSEHKTINVETTRGQKHKVKIGEFPYRTQQLFYQLIERHGALSNEPMFDIIERLSNITSDLNSKDRNNFGFHSDKSTLLKTINLKKGDFKIEYHGKVKDDFIYPDQDGALILRLQNDKIKIEIFNSTSDGYNAISEKSAGIEQKVKKEFKTFSKEYENLILKFNYSIEDYEFDQLTDELKLQSKKNLNKLFGSIEIYGEKEREIILLTEFETQ